VSENELPDFLAQGYLQSSIDTINERLSKLRNDYMIETTMNIANSRKALYLEQEIRETEAEIANLQFGQFLVYPPKESKEPVTNDGGQQIDIHIDNGRVKNRSRNPKSKVKRRTMWALPGDTTKLCRLLTMPSPFSGLWQPSEAKKRIAMQYLEAECKTKTKVQKQHRWTVNSAKICDRLLKTFHILIRRTRYNSNKPPEMEAFGAIVHWISTILVVSVCRGPLSAIDCVKELAYDCEKSAVRGLFPVHLSQILRGVNRYLAFNNTIVAIFGTLGRAMPAMQDQKRQRKALARTVIGMTAPSPPLSASVENDLRVHVRKLIKHSNPYDCDLRTNKASLNSCYENSRSKGGAYSYIKQEVRRKSLKNPNEINPFKFDIEAYRAGLKKPTPKHLRVMMKFKNDPKYDQNIYVHPLRQNERYRIKQLPLHDWDRACHTLYREDNENAIPRVRLNIIPETGGRYRVAGAGQAGLVALLHPLSAQVSGMLKNYGPLKAIFRGNPEGVLKRLQNVPNRQNIYSTDMSQATDLINQHASRIVIEELSSKLNWTTIQRQAALDSVGPVALVYEGEELCSTTSGTQLGLPLSFCILCILNAFALKGLSKRNRQTSSLFGDDSIITAPPNEWSNYVSRLESLGMRINLRKTHTSRVGAIFCGTIYRRIGTKFQILTKTKLSNLFPAGNKTWIERLDAGIEAVKGFLPARPTKKSSQEAKKAQAYILTSMKETLSPFQGKIYPNLPREYYGLGFPLLPGKIPRRYRKMLAVMFASNDRTHIMRTMNRATCVWTTVGVHPEIKAKLEEVNALADAELISGPGSYDYKSVISKAIPVAIGDATLRLDVDKVNKRFRKSPGQVAKVLTRRVRATTELWSAGKPMGLHKIKMIMSQPMTVTDNSALSFAKHYAERHETVNGIMVRNILSDLFRRSPETYALQ
jgi:hypothetical protein